VDGATQVPAAGHEYFTAAGLVAGKDGSGNRPAIIKTRPGFRAMVADIKGARREYRGLDLLANLLRLRPHLRTI